MEQGSAQYFGCMVAVTPDMDFLRYSYDLYEIVKPVVSLEKPIGKVIFMGTAGDIDDNSMDGLWELFREDPQKANNE